MPSPKDWIDSYVDMFSERYAICAEQPDVTLDEARELAWGQVVTAWELEGSGVPWDDVVAAVLARDEVRQ